MGLLIVSSASFHRNQTGLNSGCKLSYFFADKLFPEYFSTLIVNGITVELFLPISIPSTEIFMAGSPHRFVSDAIPVWLIEAVLVGRTILLQSAQRKRKHFFVVQKRKKRHPLTRHWGQICGCPVVVASCCCTIVPSCRPLTT